VRKGVEEDDVDVDVGVVVLFTVVDTVTEVTDVVEKGLELVDEVLVDEDVLEELELEDVVENNDEHTLVTTAANSESAVSTFSTIL
jgi:hypothetical protein